MGSQNNNKNRQRNPLAGMRRVRENNAEKRQLLLPGALLMTMRAQLLAAFMLIDFCLTAFFK